MISDEERKTLEAQIKAMFAVITDDDTILNHSISKDKARECLQEIEGE